MEEYHVVPQLIQDIKQSNNDKSKKNDIQIVPEYNNIIEKEEDIVIVYENDELYNELEDIDIVLVLEMKKLSNSPIHATFMYGNINEITETYPFEEQYIEQDPRSLNLTIVDIQTIRNHINIPTIIETMNLLEISIYYIIFEQRN
jgi:hypothetical protein